MIEALEGYSKIYTHSKYFVIEESQICVDHEGNIKVWVNHDLSLNFPNCDLEENYQGGEQEMVQRLV